MSALFESCRTGLVGAVALASLLVATSAAAQQQPRGNQEQPAQQVVPVGERRPPHVAAPPDGLVDVRASTGTGSVRMVVSASKNRISPS